MRGLIRHILREHTKEISEYTRWTPEMVADIAKKYNKRTDFFKNEQGAYKWAYEKGILDDITSHMQQMRTNWTKDMVHNEALKYKSRSDFSKGSSKAYDQAKRKGWMEDVTKHMKEVVRWTKEMVQEEALKYATRKEFFENSPRAYSAAVEHGWLDDVANHMHYLGNLYKRMVYAFEFPDNSVYVGLTLNEKQREKQHLKLDDNTNSAVSKHIIETGLTPIKKSISNGYLPSEDAQKLEKCAIEDYRQKSWNILNKATAGALGFCERSWTYESIKDDVLKYDSKSDWIKNGKKSYVIASLNGWIEELSTHMSGQKRHKWTEKEVELDAQKYKTKSDWVKNSPAIQWARKKGILDKITSHMEPQTWSDDTISKEAKKYNNHSEFRKNSKEAYKAAIRRKILPQVTSHMDVKSRTKNKWTKEELLNVMNDYESINSFRKNNSPAFQSAFRILGNDFIKTFYKNK